MYRCEAASVEGFVQQVAVSYVGQGYWFYVSGIIPKGKDPAAVDAKLIARYGIDITKWARARRKRAGLGNMQYLRHGRFFVLLATHGQHPFFEDEPGFRDARRHPIQFHGYSIGYRRGADGKSHPSVRIHVQTYRQLKAYLLDLALRRPVEVLAEQFRSLRFVPYAPIRRQYLNLLRAVNRQRQIANLEMVPIACLRLRRRPIKVFESRILEAAA